MALKPWHRAALTAAGMMLAAVGILPSRPLPEEKESGWALRVMMEGGVSSYYSVGQHRWILSATHSDLVNRVFAARLSDSLQARARGASALKSGDGAVTVLYAPPLTADSARVWLRMMERELALAPAEPGASHGVPVIAALVPVDPTRPGTRGPGYTVMKFVSPRVDQPACMVSVRLGRVASTAFDPVRLLERDRNTGTARTAVLDWCLMYARFGSPGPQVERWVSRRIQMTYWYSGGATYSWSLDPAQRGALHEDRAQGLSRRIIEEGLRAPVFAACAHGGGPVCLKSVELASDRSFQWDRSWTNLARHAFVASLLLKDPAAFGRFWRSPEPPAVALEHAYGRPATELVAEWLRSVSDVPKGGSRTPPLTLLSSLGWAALAIGIGLVFARRREVGS